MNNWDHDRQLDTGCEVSPSCLQCPLEKCRFDDPAWFRQHQQWNQDLRVLKTMRVEGLTVGQAAQRFSVTTRTIFRTLRRCRDLAQEEV